MFRLAALSLAVTTFMISCVQKSEKDLNEPLKYPITKKVEQTDNYFGVSVADPYRWLENDTAEDVKQWVTEQNKVTFGYLEKIPFRNKIKDRLTDIFNYPKYSNPFKAGDYYFFSKNDGLQNQSVIYFQKGLDGKPEVFIDPNSMSSDGTAAVTILGFSHDKRYVAYAVNQSGSDWQTIYVMEVATKKLLDDKLDWVKFSGASWKGNGFYYSRYDAPVKGKEFSQKNEYHKIYYHQLGDPQDKDILVFEDKTKPLRYYGASVTEDERFLIIYVSEGTDGTELYCKDLINKQKDFTLLFKGFEDNYSVLNNIGDKLLVQTDAGAPNQKVVLVDPKKPNSENWKEIISEKSELLQSAATGGGKIFASYLKDVATHVYQFDYAGNLEREIALPALGNAYGFGGYEDDQICFYTFTSFTYPPTIYRYDIASGKSEVWQKTEVKFNPDDYETKQVFYNSKDGTKVPMFIVYKKGTKLDGTNPTLLYGYGGFNISLEPNFSTSRIILLENGGIFALANIRGGGEYGEKWHEAGKLLNKQNVFDDFISAAEYLIKEKYTSPEKLAIQGGSNGGLLVGACMLQRPDLFRVAFPAVGVMDMLRYHKFTVGWGWAVEYGSSDSLTHFKNLYSYSPLHNIKDSVEYPATMVTTADHDDRVVPAHSFKFIATLQEHYKGNRPQLIRIDVKAGHGAGKPISKIIEEQADIWSFMFYNMGVKPIYK
jgi:prolyl oligopeptidase